jgi:hypothetical protein
LLVPRSVSISLARHRRREPSTPASSRRDFKQEDCGSTLGAQPRQAVHARLDSGVPSRGTGSRIPWQSKLPDTPDSSPGGMLSIFYSAIQESEMPLTMHHPIRWVSNPWLFDSFRAACLDHGDR